MYINIQVAAVAALATSVFAAPQLSVRQTPIQSCNATATQTHTVVSGDTLTTIAAIYGVGICDLAKANGISNINLINLNQKINVPAGICKPDSTSCVTTTKKPAGNCTIGGPNSYRVRSGDTLTVIAGYFEITLDALVAANPAITNIDLIYVDQLINIPVCARTQCIVATYSIVSGDIFYDLAANHGSTVGQVLASNQAIDPTKLSVGQQIMLPSWCGYT